MKQVDTYFVLDFDRCIGNTEKAHEILWSVIESETRIKTDELKAAKTEIDKKGFTFDTTEYVTRELLRRESQKSWQDVRRVFVATAKLHDILEPQAVELLDLLEARQIHYGILTYGKESWQLTKLEAARLVERNVPFEITQIEHKGQILAGWKHENMFAIPPAMVRGFEPLCVQNIVFLDDKPRSFEGMPAGVHGICVRSTVRPLLPSQRGEVPHGVDEVRGIGGVIELLFG